MARLLTVLGRGNYQTARYYPMTDPGRGHETPYAPVATAALLGTVSVADILMTPEAKAMHWAACREGLAAVGVEARERPIPLGLSEDEIWRIFHVIADTVEEGAEIVVDVTHSLRHLPFLLFASLTYLTACRRVKVRGVYYGAYEAKSDNRVPIVDLAPLLILSDWYHAVRTFAETGNPDRVARLLREAQRTLVSRSQEPDPALGKLQGGLQALAWSLPTGLPLETGLRAVRATDAISELIRAPSRAPIVATALGGLDAVLSPLRLATPVKSKAHIRLDRVELARQLEVIRFLARSRLADRALLLLREWIINRCLLARGEGSEWLDYAKVRLPMERALNALAERRRILRGEDAWNLGSFWRKVADCRNAIAHAGFRPEEVNRNDQELEGLIRACEVRSDDEASWNTAVPGSLGRVLVTPFGLSPGVLFTALRALVPDRALVITSVEAKTRLAETCAQAGWNAEPVASYVVQDPHACFGEVDALQRWAQPTLLEAREVLVNLTGGTTGMQYLAERLAAQAARLGVPTQRYALLDRRSPEEQRREPFVLGEAMPLQGDEGSAVGG